MTRKEVKELMPGYRIPPVKRQKATLTETDVQTQICKYLKAQYPHVMFMSDSAAGAVLSPGMVSRMKLHRSAHSFPDLIIFEPKGVYHALFIEIKRDRDTLYCKDGSMRINERFQNQFKAIQELDKRKYFATFACGFDEAKKLIDNYMSL